MNYLVPYSQFSDTQESKDGMMSPSLEGAKLFIDSNGVPGRTYIIKKQNEAGPVSIISYQVHPLRDDVPPNKSKTPFRKTLQYGVGTGKDNTLPSPVAPPKKTPPSSPSVGY